MRREADILIDLLVVGNSSDNMIPTLCRRRILSVGAVGAVGAFAVLGAAHALVEALAVLLLAACLLAVAAPH
jgi:hypothetical protein